MDYDLGDRIHGVVGLFLRHWDPLAKLYCWTLPRREILGEWPEEVNARRGFVLQPDKYIDSRRCLCLDEVIFRLRRKCCPRKTGARFSLVPDVDVELPAADVTNALHDFAVKNPGALEVCCLPQLISLLTVTQDSLGGEGDEEAMLPPSRFLMSYVCGLRGLIPFSQ